jgi:hypothetical protein
MNVPIVTRALVPSHSRVDDAEEKEHYWHRLMQHWGVTGRRATNPTFHPGCNPHSLSRATLPALARHAYAVALKSDGVRYVLFLTTRPTAHEAPVALMIDRSRNMYEVEVLATDDHFLRGTVLEGELVWKQPHETHMVYYVFDVIAVKGVLQTSRPFSERLATVMQLVRAADDIRAEEEHMEDRVLETGCIVLVHFEPALVMRPKVFVDRCHTQRLWTDHMDAGHRVDGLILQRMDAPYDKTGDLPPSFKWKEHSTVDLRGPTHQCAGDEPLPARIVERPVHVVERRVTPTTDDDVVEYCVEVDAHEVRFVAVRQRLDKRTANGLSVVLATVQDVIDGLTPADIASVVGAQC